MCRVDDDWEWYVEATFRESFVPGVTSQATCQDCGRTFEPGEDVIRYLSMPAEDERPHVFVVIRPSDLDGRRYWLDGDPYITILDEDDEGFQAKVDALEKVGYIIDEVHDPREANPQVDHYTCVQCKAGEAWLEAICDQHTVCVTQMDLLEHLYDYDAATLGPDFVTLATLARQQWRTRDFGRLVPEPVIKRLTDDAIKHAQLVGLHP